MEYAIVNRRTWNCKRKQKYNCFAISKTLPITQMNGGSPFLFLSAVFEDFVFIGTGG